MVRDCTFRELAHFYPPLTLALCSVLEDIVLRDVLSLVNYK